MEILRKKCLQVRTLNQLEALGLFKKNNYSFTTGEDGMIELTGDEAILAPEKIATILVNSGNPPVLLRVYEEDLETFFLRVISLKEDDK
jgi:hypothetical protein